MKKRILILSHLALAFGSTTSGNSLAQRLLIPDSGYRVATCFQFSEEKSNSKRFLNELNHGIVFLFNTVYASASFLPSDLCTTGEGDWV